MEAQFEALHERIVKNLPENVSSLSDWQHISSSLRQLHSEMQKDLEEKESQLQELQEIVKQEITFSKEENTEYTCKIEKIQEEIKDFAPELMNSEQHFHQVEQVVDPMLQHLEKLQAKVLYLEKVIEIEKASQHAKQLAENASPEALVAFQAFSQLSNSLPSQYKAIQKEAYARIDTLAFGLKKFAIEKLQAILEQLEWPKPMNELELKEKKKLLDDQFTPVFEYLVKLQLAQIYAKQTNTLENEEEKKEKEEEEKSDDLWAFQCILDPVILRFRYHFERLESATNRLSKPEWYLHHILEETSTHDLFLTQCVTPILHKILPTHHLSIQKSVKQQQLICADAQILFLRGFIQAARKKITTEMQLLLSNKAVFCHTIDEVFSFEKKLTQETSYTHYSELTRGRGQFPRLIDVFTKDLECLFGWVKVDLEYAHQYLADILGNDQEKQWKVVLSTKNTSKIPPAAHIFVDLLDFLSERFSMLENEEHRFLYVTNVHKILLKTFHTLCGKLAKSKQLKRVLTQRKLHHHTSCDWVDYFWVLNTVNFVLQLLIQWDQLSPVFIALSKVAHNEKSRSNIIKYHLEYSKTAIKNAAKAASTAVLTSEEATAVKNALTGPAALIGPTAAFSAAFSVGSNTMKSLFGKSLLVDTSSTNTTKSTSIPSSVNTKEEEEESQKTKEHKEKEEEEKEEDNSFFAASIFEQQIGHYRTLKDAMIDDSIDTIIDIVRSECYRYTSSTLWTTTTTTTNTNTNTNINIEYFDVSSELTFTFDLIQQLLKLSKKHLSFEIFSLFWKKIATKIDQYFFHCILHLIVFPITQKMEKNESMISKGIQQFVYDMKMLMNNIFGQFTRKPMVYFPLIVDTCTIFEMKNVSQLVSLQNAMMQIDQDQVEQLKNMLEACQIHTLEPKQVIQIIKKRLG